MKLLKIGISGVRGIVGETITPELVLDFACAFGTYLRSGKVLVARDTRLSGPMLHAATLSALVSTGCDVLDLGICPTPIVQYLVRETGAGGAVSITAGHNNANWNALTFINQDGTYLNEFQGGEILDIYHLERFHKAPVTRLGRTKRLTGYLDAYFKSLAAFLDKDAIRKAGFTVVIDSCNGAGAGVVDRMCESLGCTLIPVNNTPTGFFPHDPEPRPRNAGEVSSITKLAGASAGFLLSSDVGRISIVAENGETLSEEYALPLIADYYLDKHPGPLVTNQSTSRMIEDVVGRRGLPIIRAKVGQSHIIQSMLAEEAEMAGEGSGSVAVRRFQPAFDGFLAMGLVLEIMAATGKKISELVRMLPKYHIVKEKIYCPPSRIHSVVAETKRYFAGSPMCLIDGVRVERADGWVHVRASTTEPMIRIISESKSKDKAQEEMDNISSFVSQLV